MGTTVQKLQAILDSKSDIKDAIEAKGVTVGDAPFDEYASKISEISGGGSEEAYENDVNFYDYDGRRIASYTIDEAKALTQAEYDVILPPAHEGLTFQEWNWSLSDITSYDRQYIDVGANYVTTDGKTRIYLHAEDNEEFSFKVTISNATLYVDWGDDNSATGTGRITLSHTYTTKGHYVVTFYSNLPEGRTFTLNVLDDTKISCVHMVDEIRVGKDVYVGNNYVFRYYTCKISISTTSLTSVNAGCFTNAIMPIVVVPKTCTSLSANVGFAAHCGIVSLPKSMTTLGATSYFFTYNSPKLILPEVTDVSWAAPANYFNNSSFIEIVSLPLSFKWDTSVIGNFNAMGNLYYVDIVQGWTPNVNLNISSSTKWTAANMAKFFNKLGTTSTAITLTFGSTNLNKLTAEQKAIATNKGYTLA